MSDLTQILPRKIACRRSVDSRWLFKTIAQHYVTLVTDHWGWFYLPMIF